MQAKMGSSQMLKLVASSPLRHDGGGEEDDDKESRQEQGHSDQIRLTICGHELAKEATREFSTMGDAHSSKGSDTYELCLNSPKEKSLATSACPQ